MCHCDNLRQGRPGTFDWSDFDELERQEPYPEMTEYVLRCQACGSRWRLQLDHTPVMPRYDWRELSA